MGFLRKSESYPVGYTKEVIVQRPRTLPAFLGLKPRAFVEQDFEVSKDIKGQLVHVTERRRDEVRLEYAESLISEHMGRKPNQPVASR